MMREIVIAKITNGYGRATILMRFVCGKKHKKTAQRRGMSYFVEKGFLLRLEVDIMSRLLQ